MSYEFNPKSTSLEFPNPFTVENYFFFASAALETVAAVTLLFLGRNYFEQHNGASSALSIAAGIAILSFAVLHAQRAMGQLRFFFGRSLPVGLAPEMGQGCDGYSRDSEWLKKTVRQNAIDYPVPEGALNGLLYSRIRDLIFAPIPIQRLAQRQFHNALAILATLISFLVSWACSSTASASWMGLFYFVFSLFLLLRPLETSTSGKADMGSRTLILLVVFTILGPVAITALGPGLPDISWLWLSQQTLFVLVAALAGVCMFFGALLHQMNKPPQTNPSLEQMSLSMNCHPNQLMGELDRKLQMEWTEQIPNRRYSRISPQVSGGVGTFQAEILEETQPMPEGGLAGMDLATAFSSPRYVWIALIDTLGLALIAIALLFLVVFALSADQTAGIKSMVVFLTVGFAALLSGNFCLRVGHLLWGRFDFKSQLFWTTMEGNYQSAKMAFGNQFRDRIQSEKEIINIETMTLRVWVSELHTVIFDRNSPRHVVGLYGLPQHARELATHLCRFAGEQSTLVSPTAQSDLQKAALMGTLNNSRGGDPNAQQVLMDAVAGAQVRSKAAPVPVSSSQECCGRCNTPARSGDRFCAVCGTGLV